MAENYMEKYIDLSQKFKEDNNSKENIEKLYEFMDILESEEKEGSKMVLTYVYTILGFHKKSYELYKVIYNQNDKKQKSKLFNMEQLANTHGDNFIVKNILGHKIDGKIEFILNDFIEKETSVDWKHYILNKTCMIFDKNFDNEPLELIIHGDLNLERYLEEINKYLKWLYNECKNDLIAYYNKNMEAGIEADMGWYDELEIYGVLITITKDEKFCSDICCGDNYFKDHILDIEFEEKKIFSMNYDG